MGSRALLLWLCLAPAAALAADLAPLVQARAKVDDLDYPGALKLLDAALETDGLEREALVEIHELKGVCFATLGKVDKAREAFRTLLVLDPDHALGSAQPPRVKTPFYEAKEWAAKAGAVKLEAEPQKAGDEVQSLTVRVPPDGLGLARAVALHVDVNGLRRDEQVALDASTRTATVKVGGPSYRWWAEILGDRGAVLLRKGTAEEPNLVEPPKPDAPVAVQLAPQLAEPKAPAGLGMRVAGAVVGGGGVVALVVGAALGATSVDARNRIANATRDEQGNVVGITQRQAAELDAQARDFGAVANVLMIGGAVLSAGGLLLVIFAPSDEAVAVAPAPGGAVVSGRF